MQHRLRPLSPVPLSVREPREEALTQGRRRRRGPKSATNPKPQEEPHAEAQGPQRKTGHKLVSILHSVFRIPYSLFVASSPLCLWSAALFRPPCLGTDPPTGL